MKRNISLVLEPEVAFDPIRFQEHVCKLLQIPVEEQTHIRAIKRSIDARSRQIKVNIDA